MRQFKSHQKAQQVQEYEPVDNRDSAEFRAYVEMVAKVMPYCKCKPKRSGGVTVYPQCRCGSTIGEILKKLGNRADRARLADALEKIDHRETDISPVRYVRIALKPVVVPEYTNTIHINSADRTWPHPESYGYAG